MDIQIVVGDDLTTVIGDHKVVAAIRASAATLIADAIKQGIGR